MNRIVKDIAADAARKGITVQHVIDITGMDRKTVSGILDGTAENPKCESVQAVAEAIGGRITYSPEGETKLEDDLVKQALKAKDKWIKWLFLTCIGLIVLDTITTLVTLIIAL